MRSQRRSQLTDHRAADLGGGRGERVLHLLDRGSRWWGFLVVAATLLLAHLVALGSGEARSVSRHWFYVPVVIAAVRLGVGWTGAVAVAAGLLAGPLVHLPEVGFGWSDHGRWLVRLGFFLVIGVLVAALVDSLRRFQAHKVRLVEHERELAEQERALAVQRAAVIQTVSHELRTPLTIIRGTVETWTRMADDITPEAAARLLPPMSRATRRLESLVAMVLAAADAEGEDELATVEVDVTDLLAEATLRAAGPKERARVEHVVEGDHGRVCTVPDFVVTALAVLVNNGLKFSSDEGPVTVTASVDGPGRAEFVVRDRGVGFQAAAFARLFEPFTQADQSTTRGHEGLGVGLYTANKLVRRLGGDLDIATHPDGGTVARIRIPVVVPALVPKLVPA